MALKKLKITGYKDTKYNSKASTQPNPISVMINPSSYARGLGFEFNEEKASGADGKSRTYNRDLGESLMLDLVFDGTGTVPDAPTKSVEVQIADLRRLAVQVNGDIHTPNYLVLAWGTLLFKGVLKSLAIDYNLFAPDGTPLRAKVKAGFLGFNDNSDGRAAQNRSSPDLTHAIVVEAGDTLPLLCHEIYRDSRYYLAVAAHNGLDDFRALTPGRTLLFPPLAGAGS